MPTKSKTTKKIKRTRKETLPTNFSIQAFAGTGKTTTMEWTEYPNQIPDHVTPSEEQEAIFLALSDRPKGQTRFACFNNSIQAEAEPRFPTCDVRNNHKLGLHAVRDFLNLRIGRNFIKGNKYNDIAKTIIGNPYDDNKLWPEFTDALKLCDLARCTLTGHPVREGTDDPRAKSFPHNTKWEVTPGELADMAAFYNIDIEEPRAFQHVESLINIGINLVPTSMDFTDMVFAPNVFNARPDKAAFCYIDECQDLNAAQQGIHVNKWDPTDTSAEAFGVVGDTFQSMYGFAGSDPDAMRRMESNLSAGILPLTVTRRCPHSHVEYAKRFLPEDCAFSAAPEAPDGTITHADFTTTFYEEQSEITVLPGLTVPKEEVNTNLFLSRTNAPLVRHCFMCWKNGIPAVIRGRDVGANLASKIKKCKADDPADVLNLISEDYETIFERLRKLDKTDLLSAKEDELDIITTFLTEAKTKEEAVDNMYSMFNDKVKLAKAIQFSTVHKAKGLEADRVGIITPELLPHPGISKLGAFWAQQERNIAYVCATRGKNLLFLNQEGGHA